MRFSLKSSRQKSTHNFNFFPEVQHPGTQQLPADCWDAELTVPLRPPAESQPTVAVAVAVAQPTPAEPNHPTQLDRERTLQLGLRWWCVNVTRPDEHC